MRRVNTRYIYILWCVRVIHRFIIQGTFYPAMLPHTQPIVVGGTFGWWHVAADTPSSYSRHLSTLTCRRVCTLLLYAADFHLVLSPRIHPHIIRGRFPPCHVAMYTPSYYTRHISILSCRRIYTLILYAADFHPVMSPRIHPHIIRGTFPSCHVAAYTPSYYTPHFSALSCRRVYTLILYAAHFHPVTSPRIHPHIIRGRFPSC